jgi:hypothetical protein
LQLTLQGSKVHYKKKLRPVTAKPHERFQQQQQQSQMSQPGGRGALGTSPSTTEVLSTSPESHFRSSQQSGGQERLQMGDNCLPVVVRENPMFFERLVELRQFQLEMNEKRPNNNNNNSNNNNNVTQQQQQQQEAGQRVRTLGMRTNHSPFPSLLRFFHSDQGFST